MGTARYLMFYFICGLAAALVHYFTNQNSTLPTVGASGAIAGVLGAYFFFYPSARVITLIPLFFLPLFCRNSRGDLFGLLDREPGCQRHALARHL